MVFAAIGAALGISAGAAAVGTGLLATAGASIYGTIEQGNIASQGLNLAQTTQSEQEQYNQMLMKLMQNPAAYLSSPLFQSTLTTGLTGVAHQLGAATGGNAGMETTGLEQFGQSLASNQLLQQESLLASISGAGAASSPSQGLGAATGATAASVGNLNSLAGLLAFFGAGGLASAGGGVSATGSASGGGGLGN
jgi:hypothetical protein